MSTRPQRWWGVTLLAAAFLMVTMGARQSLGLFVSPMNTTTGLGIVTISLGVAALVPAPSRDAEALINLADVELYRAKRTGRNRVEVRSPQIEPPGFDEGTEAPRFD